MNIFLTGIKSIGKSTLLLKILNNINYKKGGYITEKSIINNNLNFNIISLSTNSVLTTIATVNLESKKPTIFLNGFTTISHFLEKDLLSKDILILDELGFMEEKSKIFKDTIFKILDSNTPVLGVLKQHDCPFLNAIRYRKDVIIFEVTKENRESLFYDIKKLI